MFDLDEVNKGAEMMATNQPLNPDDHSIAGRAVPPGAVVRVTNLDQALNTASGNATDAGTFEVTVTVLDGEELRFEWVDGDERSAPADAVFRWPDPASPVFVLEDSPRFACLRLEPGFVLDFAADGPAVLTLHNDCDSAVNLDNARSRLALGDFMLPDTLPLDIAPGESAELSVDFTRGAASLREDVLLLDVTLDAATIRYPITLRAE